MIDQRKLPAQEVYVRCKTARGGGARDQDDGHPRRAGDRRRGGDGHRARHAPQQGDRHAEVRRRVLQDLRADGGDAADRGQPVLGDRADEAMRSPRRRRRASRSTRSRTGSIVEARAIHDEDVASCRAMGAFGADVVPDEARDSDALQRRRAGDRRLRHRARRDPRRGRSRASASTVFADETRPFLQGARLTAWELVRDGIETTVITDNMAGALMRQGKVDLVVVGADRIAANGDTANKIGTYGVAVLAREHEIPFYVAAPLSTIDLDTPDGASIPIEERNAREVTHLGGVAAGARRARWSGTRRSTSRRTASSPASSPSGASSAAVHESLKRAFEESGSANPKHERTNLIACFVSVRDAIDADPRHRNVLRRNLGRRRRGNRRRRAAVGDPLERRSRRRCRFIASGAASCPSSRRGSTSATSAASSSARSTRRGTTWRDLGAVAVTQGPGLVGSLLVGVSFAKAAAAAAGLPLVAVHHLAGHIESLVLQNGELPLPAVVLVVSGGHTSLYLVDAPGLRISCSAARATMRRARRTTRSRSCSASAIRAGRSIDRLARDGNDRAIALPTTRLTHADRNAPRAERRSRLQLQRPEDRGAAPRRAARDRPSAARPSRRSPTSARASSASSSTRWSIALFDAARRHQARGASASPAACRPTAACAPS